VADAKTSTDSRHNQREMTQENKEELNSGRKIESYKRDRIKTQTTEMVFMEFHEKKFAQRKSGR